MPPIVEIVGPLGSVGMRPRGTTPSFMGAVRVGVYCLMATLLGLNLSLYAAGYPKEAAAQEDDAPSKHPARSVAKKSEDVALEPTLRRRVVPEPRVEPARSSAEPPATPAQSSDTFEATTVILVICFERPELLRRCLASIVARHPCGGLRVLVSQDGLSSRQNVEAVEQEVGRARAELVGKCGTNLVSLVRHDAQTRDGSGYHKLSRHFKFALGRAFAEPRAARVVVLEEDLEIASDFLSLFQALAPALDEDETLLAVSAWNDNGQTGRVSSAEAVFRSDFFPGLGWMLNVKLWAELGPKWPDAYWDDWLREPAQRKGRHTLRPEICRSFHVSSSKGTSQNQYGEFLARTQIYAGPPVDFIGRRHTLLADLAMEAYDADFVAKLQAAAPMAALPIDYKHRLDTLPSAIRLEYSTVEDRGRPDSFPAIARKLGIMDNVKAGVPRTAYRGVVHFWLGPNVYVYLAPSLDACLPRFFRLDGMESKRQVL